LNAHPKSEWFNDDSFWIDQYPVMFSDQRFAEAADQAERLIELVSPQGREVLDLGCGPGRFAVPLAQKGFRVTGVDRTAFLLEKARLRAEAAQVEIGWVQQDMREFIRPAAFDLVISMLTSFGYFEDRGDDLTVLRNMLMNLKPGGACVIDVKGKEAAARTLQRTTAEVRQDGAIVVKRCQVVDEWTRVRNEVIVIREGQEKRTFRFDVTLYSGQELRDRLESVGFSDVKLYGDLSGGEYGFNAERLIAVGRKSERDPSASASLEDHAEVRRTAPRDARPDL
jgi:2-polyprenyl-3-methyl-5-hydroxy-6-metoxy-1,4-benzoquinol methylase